MKTEKSNPLLRFAFCLLLFALCLSARADTNGTFVSELNLPIYVARAITYEPGQSLENFRAIEELIRQSANQPALRKLLDHQLGKMLIPVASEETRLFAARHLAVLGSERALPDIARMLNAPDTVSLGCLALSTYPHGEADKVLREALAGAQGNARIQILNTLGDRRDAGSVKTLAELAQSTDVAVVEAAVAALGKIGNTQSRKALETLFKGDLQSESVRTLARLQAGLELAEAGDKDAVTILESLLNSTTPVYVRRSALAGLLKVDHVNAPLRIVGVLRGSDEALKPVAIAAVRDLRDKEASHNFGDTVLPQLPPEQQVWLIESLAARKDAAACAALAMALASSTETSVRQAAAQALGRIGNPEFAAPLAGALARLNPPPPADDSEAPRPSVLTNVEEAGVIVAAVAALREGSETDEAVLAQIKAAADPARAALVSSLAARRSPEVIAALFEEIDGTNAASAKAAFRVMAKAVTKETLFDLLTKFARLRNEPLQAQVETFVEQAVVTVEDAKARSESLRAVLAQTFQTPGRAGLVRILPLCADTNSLKVAIRCLYDPERPVRDSAVGSLAEWPDVTAWDALIGIHKSPREPGYRAVALRGLVRLASEQNAKPNLALVKRYGQLLTASKDDNERKLILGALGGAAHPEALKLAVGALNYPRVRAEAEAAIKRIADAIKEKHPEEAKLALNRLPSSFK
jgi:HEAT repeat protein